MSDSEEYNDKGWSTAKEPCACNYAILANGTLQHEPACQVPALQSRLASFEAQHKDLETIHADACMERDMLEAQVKELRTQAGKELASLREQFHCFFCGHWFTSKEALAHFSTPEHSDKVVKAKDERIAALEEQNENQRETVKTYRERHDNQNDRIAALEEALRSARTIIQQEINWLDNLICPFTETVLAERVQVLREQQVALGHTVSTDIKPMHPSQMSAAALDSGAIAETPVLMNSVPKEKE